MICLNTNELSELMQLVKMTRNPAHILTHTSSFSCSLELVFFTQVQNLKSKNIVGALVTLRAFCTFILESTFRLL